MKGLQTVLSEKERVFFTQEFPFPLHIATVVLIVTSYLLPVIAKMALQAIAALQLQVHLLHFLQEGGIIPGGAVEHGGHIAGRSHGAELFVVLFRKDVLTLVQLKQDVSGVAHYAGGAVGGEEELACPA
jgi:hypothetical protein